MLTPCHWTEFVQPAQRNTNRSSYSTFTEFRYEGKNRRGGGGEVPPCIFHLRTKMETSCHHCLLRLVLLFTCGVTTERLTFPGTITTKSRIKTDMMASRVPTSILLSGTRKALSRCLYKRSVNSFIFQQLRLLWPQKGSSDPERTSAISCWYQLVRNGFVLF